MPFITQGKTNWKFLLIVIILAIIVGVGAFQYSRKLGQFYQPPEIKKPEKVVEDEVEIKGLVQNFYNAIENQNGETVISYFTPPLTDEEKESYKWLTGVDLPQPTYRMFLRVKISNPVIESIKKIEEGKFQVNVKDEFQSYSNVTAKWSNPTTRNIKFILVKIEDQWLVEKYTWENPNIIYRTEKYSGFGQEQIITDLTNWKTYRNGEYGFEIKYPEKLNTEFISLHPKSVPPKMVVSSNISQLVCEEFEKKSTIEFPTATQKKITVEGEVYCRFSGAEGTAGTTYVTYRYSTIKNEKQIILEFTLLYPDCGNYYGADDKMEKCRQEEDAFDPDILAHQMLSTFRFLE